MIHFLRLCLSLTAVQRTARTAAKAAGISHSSGNGGDGVVMVWFEMAVPLLPCETTVSEFLPGNGLNANAGTKEEEIRFPLSYHL